MSFHNRETRVNDESHGKHGIIKRGYPEISFPDILF